MLTLAVECATKSIGLALLDEEDVLAELYFAWEDTMQRSCFRPSIGCLS